MVAIEKYSAETGKVTKDKFDEKVFGDKILGKTLREAVLMYEANLRQGNADTKERGDVRGSTKKPFKQKGTGNARAGSRKSPIWRGGGTVFGPHPRDFGWQMPRQQLRVALRSALLGKLQDGEMALLAQVAMKKPSSKDARKIMHSLKVEGSCCVVLEKHDENIWRSFRNFPHVAVTTADDLNAFEVCLYRKLLVEEKAMEKLQDRLAKKVKAKTSKGE